MDSSDVEVANGVGSNAKRLLMARPGHGSKGRTIQLLTNHFRVALPRTLMENACLYQYDVALFYAYTHPGGTPVERATDAYKGVERRVMDRVFEIYHTELFTAKNYAYDGDKSLFTVCELESNKLEEYEVILEDISSSKVGVNTSPEGSESDKKRMKRLSRSKTFKVKIRHAATIPIQAIADGLRGQESSYFQGALRALDIILRQHAARQGCLLVKQSFLLVDPRNFMDLNGGVQGCQGFHSSFRATQDGLSLNVDVTTTLTVRPGPVLDFLLRNQNVSDPNMIDWTKAKRMLKNLRIKVNNIEYKITGLSDLPCRNQKFLLRQGRNDHGEVQSVEITVLEYFEIRKQINLPDSADMPCIDVGKPKSPCYFPMELCNLVSLQRYTEALTNLQRAALVSQSRQRPQERRTALTDLLRNNEYENEPMLRSSGITVDSQLAPIQGRVLQAPKISVGNDEQFFPQDGRWNFNDKKLADPVKIERWAVVVFSFSKPCDIQGLWNDLMKCAKMKGIFLNTPFQIFEENPQFKREPASVRVERMYSEIKSKLPWKPQLLLCILPERKNSDIYGPWKRRNLCDEGVFTQCIAPTRVNDQYLTNVLLKINAKLGGMNFFLSLEGSHSIPLVSQEPTLILGMDVSHGSPGRSDAPSIAAVVSSRCWPEISRYRAAVRTQSPKVEMIANLFKPVDTEDHGIIRELLVDFRASSGNRKPKHIIIFRVGVSESQFNQVLNIELDQIVQACKHLDESWDPKFTLIVAQKNHHTKFFLANSPHNVPPGTVVDKSICHPKNNDFYMCAHAAKIGTTRPTHYHVLYDDIGFSADALQELVHSLSYVYQRSTTAISVVAPICYAHLAAAQMGQFMKFDEFSESSSSHGGVTSAGASQVPELPRLHENVTSSMFFC